MNRSVHTALLLAAASFALTLPQGASAAGGSVAFSGGTPGEQATVHAALNASSFNWTLLPQTILVTIQTGGSDYATPGNVYFDSGLLDQGRFAWGTIDHEFGHQVDFLLLDDAKRAQLAQSLGGTVWFPSGAVLPHSAYSCERFASLISWAYWPSADNALRPVSATDEAGAMPAPAFRVLLSQVLATPSLATAPPAQKVFAPTLTRKVKR